MSRKQAATGGTAPGRVSPGRAVVAALHGQRAALWSALALSVVSAGLNIAQPLVVSRVIDQIPRGPVGAEVALLTALVLVGTALGAVQHFVLSRAAEGAVLSVRRSLIDRLLRLPVSAYDQHRTGDLVTRLGADTALLAGAYTGGIVDAVSGMLVIVGSLIAMAVIDPLMLGVVVVVIVAAAAAIILASGRIQQATNAAQESVGRLGADTERALSAIRTVRALGAERQVGLELQGTAENVYRQGVRIARVEALLWPVGGLATQVAFLAVLGIGGARVASGDLAVGELVAFVLFLFMVAMPLAQAFSAVVSVRSAMGAMERIRGVLDLAPESTTGDVAPVPEVGVHAAAQGRNEIVLDRVSFGYAPGEPVLRDVSFTIRAGQTTAIVGPSGSGKSTLLALIERFYEIDGGRLLVDGVDVREMDHGALRARLGYVEQEAPVLQGTVRENLELGRSDADAAAMWSALGQVGLADRVAGPDGLDTVVGERGVTLSGGERQRLAFARILVRDSPVLLLDEPTASVDSRNEHLIQEATRATGAGGRTVVIVAHRLSTVTDADQIVVLDAGRVVGTGRHPDLLESNELYRDLAARQGLV